MSFVTDIRAVSESAIEQLAGRFDDLPRPLLAAIGAGDLAVEQWAALRDSIMDQFADGGANGLDAVAFTTDLSGRTQQFAGEYAGRLQQAATELPQRAQTIAAEVTESIQAFAAQLPAQAQGLILRLPEKIAELSSDTTAEAVRDTVNAYTELVGMIYGGLADRGERTWSKVRSLSLRPGTVVDAAPGTPKRAPETPTRVVPAGSAAARGPAVSTAAQPSTRSHVSAKVTTAAPKTARAARSAAAEAPSATTRKTAPKTATTIKAADGSTGTSKPRAPKATPTAKPRRANSAVKAGPKGDAPTGTSAPTSHPAGGPAVSTSGVKSRTKRPPAAPA